MKLKFDKNMQVEDLREWIKEEKLSGLRLYEMLRRNPEQLQFSGYKTPADALNRALDDIEKKLKAWEKEQGV